jgi:hypothetical protein
MNVRLKGSARKRAHLAVMGLAASSEEWRGPFIEFFWHDAKFRHAAFPGIDQSLNLARQAVETSYKSESHPQACFIQHAKVMKRSQNHTML